MSDLELDLDLIATLRSLEEHRVEFVLVGDVANAIHDHGGFVSSVAIVPGDYGRNVDRLVRALDALDAELGIAGRPDPRGSGWRHEDLRHLAPCSFMTAHADLDVDFLPIGANGYRDLFQDAERHDLPGGVHPHVASLEDLIRLGRSTAPAAHPPAALQPAALSLEPAALPLQPAAPALQQEPWAHAEIRASRTRTPHE